MDHTQNQTTHRSLATYVEVVAEEAVSDVPTNVLIGRRSISKARFQRMADGINQRRNTQVTAVEVRGHYKRLEDEYRAFKELITSEGFFWDKEANVVVATAERWDNYLEVSSYLCANVIVHCRILMNLLDALSSIKTTI